MKAKDWILIIFVIVFPFNLFIGRIIPETVSLPLYVADILLLLLGIFVIINWKKVDKTQKQIIMLFALFLLWSAVSIIFHWHELITELGTNNAMYEVFKKILSDNILHMINKMFHLFLAFILCIAILQSSLKKEKLLRYACIPLIIIVIANIFLVLAQQDVKLDGGKSGTVILPYGIKEVERAYFPFVNSLLLSLYLSVGFFVLLYLLLNEKDKQKRILYETLMFALLIALDFTKGRAALACVLGLYALFIMYLFMKKIDFPKKTVIALGIFLVLLNMHIFIFHNFSFLATVNTFFVDDDEINQTVREELGEITTEQLNQTVREELGEITTEQLNQISLQVANQYSEFHSRRKTYHWPTVFALFKEEPMTGIGTGLFFYSVLHSEKDVLCRTDLLCPDKQQPTDMSSTAHSIYLQILAENGIIGICLFMFFLGALGVYTYKQYKNSMNSLLIIAIACFLTQGALFSYFEYFDMVYLFWLLIGIATKKE